MKFIKSFILCAMKVEKHINLFLELDFENFQIKIESEGTNCLLKHSHHLDYNF